MLTTYRFSSLIVAWKATVPTGHEGRHQIAEYEIACNPYICFNTNNNGDKKRHRIADSMNHHNKLFRCSNGLRIRVTCTLFGGFAASVSLNEEST